MTRAHQRISARDYKHGGRRGGWDLGRYRQFGLGLTCGLAVAVGVFVFDRRTQPAVTAVAQESPKSKAAAAPTGEADEAAEQYDFYDMLPKFEVVLPEERNVQRDQPSVPVRQPGAYIIQAGSFGNESEALRRQQQLAKLGMSAAVQRVAIDADVKHRVRIGPISDLARLNEIRGQLRTADIDALLIKVPD